jgi:hypothetical protein
MAKVALLTVHGMGETKEDYHLPLLKALQKKLKNRFDEVSVHRVYYQNILQGNEAVVWQACKALVHYDDLRKFLLFGFADAAGLETNKDAPRSVYELAQREIASRMLEARATVGPDGPIVAIAQSLGCQMLSSYIYDAQKARKARAGGPNAPRYPSAGLWQQPYVEDGTWDDAKLAYASGATLSTLLTTGCNIPIFVAAHKTMSIIPIDKPNGEFEWHNFYDPDDVLGWPLVPLRGGYETLVQDHPINSGQGFINWVVKSWNPLSHTAYWTDDNVVDPLAQALRDIVDAA